MGHRQPAVGLAVPGRADGVEQREDPDRGKQGRGAGSAFRRCERAHVVSDHSFEQPGGVHRGVPEEAPGGSGREEDVRGGSGRRRAGGRRHGDRRGLGRCASADGDGGPGYLADVGVRGAGLLRRDSRCDHRRAEDGAEHRVADPDEPGRHPQASPPGTRDSRHIV